ncbi:steroid 17-alpha-hydroxylase/17,20 lyase-like [Ptychodera flava]|uniref:steroid 17-alpha-hydroxylase/17,20 lyase-like n=1 Tax=Ptychodera flava TaxID=63121 RepID=UPI00396A3CEB
MCTFYISSIGHQANKMVSIIPDTVFSFPISSTDVIMTAVLAFVLAALFSMYVPNGFPPGPVALPFVVNSLGLRGDQSEILLTLSKRYCDILSVKINGRKKVIINDVDMIREALVKKEFSGKPWRFFNDVLSEGGKDITDCSYSPEYVARRKLLIRLLRNATVRHRMEDSARDAFLKVKNSIYDRNGKPFNLQPYLALVVGSAASSMCFGRKYKIDDPEFREIISTFQNLSKRFSHVLPAEIFPILRHVPTKGVLETKKAVSDWLMLIQSKIDQQKTQHNEGEVYGICDGLLKFLKDADESGRDVSSWLTDVNVRQILSNVFIAAMVPTVTTMAWLVAYLVNYPDVQTRMQKEIDDVIGRKSLLLSSDAGTLRYCRAVILEVLRIRTVALRGLPHQTLEDTCLGGYSIPSGTEIWMHFANVHMNSKYWQEPEEFHPERFLDEDGSVLPTPNTFLPFSAGRRKCAGESSAMNWITFTCISLFHHFTFSPAPGQGKPSLKPDCSTGINECSPYEVVSRPRIGREMYD